MDKKITDNKTSSDKNNIDLQVKSDSSSTQVLSRTQSDIEPINHDISNQPEEFQDKTRILAAKPEATQVKKIDTIEEKTRVSSQTERTRIYQETPTQLQQAHTPPTEVDNRNQTSKKQTSNNQTSNNQNDDLNNDASDQHHATENITHQATRIQTTKKQTSQPADKIKAIFNGQIINNRFVLESKLGEGGMGEVYLAKDMRRVELGDKDPYVVLKFLHEEFYSDTRFIRALQRESKKTQRLSHPNVITVYDFDKDSNLAYISMEYLQGESLDLVIAERDFTVKRLLYIIERMARGLAYAHQEGFVHADFKPANVIFTKDETVKLLDFGIAQAVIQEKGRYRSDIIANQQDAELAGVTPRYASPQTIAETMPLPVDDVYSFCCVAYELLAGHMPWKDKDGNMLDAKQAMDLELEPEPLKGVPNRFAKAIMKGLSFEREDRFQHAGQFLDAVKPRFTKVQLGLAASFALIAVTFYFIADTWLENKVPSLTSFDQKLTPVITVIKEADEMLELGDTDFAHRLYVQAWEEFSDGKVKLSDKKFKDSDEKLKKVIDDRMNGIAKKLIREIDEASAENNLLRLQELESSLAFLKKAPLGSYDERIQERLVIIRKQIKQLEVTENL